MFPWVTFMPIPDDSSEPDGAGGAPGKDTKTGRGLEAGGDRARNTKQEVNRAGSEAQGTEPSRETPRCLGQSLQHSSHPTSLHWVRRTKDRLRRPTPTPPHPTLPHPTPLQPITKQGPSHCTGPSLSSPTPTPHHKQHPHSSAHPSPHTHKCQPCKLTERTVNTGARCGIHTHTCAGARTPPLSQTTLHRLSETDTHVRQALESVTHICPSRGNHRCSCTRQLHPQVSPL